MSQGAAVVSAIRPIRQLVRGEDKAPRRYLVILPGTPDTHGAPVQVHPCTRRACADRNPSVSVCTCPIVNGTDHGRDARSVVDLLHEGADYLRYFRCRARVACPNQLADLIAAALPVARPDHCQVRPVGRGRIAAAAFRDPQRLFAG